MKCLVTDAKRRDCFWFRLRLSSLPVDTHWKYKRELKTETRIVWQRMKTRVRFLRYSSEWYESEWLWNQRAWKAWDESADGENGNSGAPSSVEPAGGVKELKTPDERLMKEVQIRWPTSVAARKPEKVLISPQTLCDIKLWKKISLHVFDQFQIQSRKISAIFALHKVWLQTNTWNPEHAKGSMWLNVGDQDCCQTL